MTASTEPQWPWCQHCARRAEPGIECDRAACPFQRELVDGRLHVIRLRPQK